ncbi:MAG: TonB-dependent receptor, plug [Acidobacteriales bacterium]|nr:TonB-dependent receptor, plug [Terriglobales bacterium]
MRTSWLRSFTRALHFGCLIVLIALSVSSWAQETTGGIQGTVKDPQGAVISGAKVTITGSALIGTKTATTDSAGTYRFTQLPPGTYQIDVTATGFGNNKLSGVKLEVGALPIINIGMKLGTESTTVEVSSEGPAVDVTQSKVQTNVTREILDGIPKGRSFQSVIPFAPGARMEPLQNSTMTGRDNGFQIDGASDSENVYLIDGINTTNVQGGGIGKSFNMDFVQEVQVKTTSFEAEFGGALGGVINAIPKRGSNSWHGEFLTYLRTNALNANDPCASSMTSSAFSTVCGLRIDPTKASLNTTARLDGTPEYYVPNKDKRRILEPGFTISGPLMKDRLWLFNSYIPYIDTITRTTTFTGLNAGPRELSQNTIQHNLYSRLDYRMSDRLRLFAGWNYGYSRVKGSLGSPDSAYGQRNAGSGVDPNTIRPDAGTVNPLSVYTFGGDWTPTSKLVVSSRIGYFFSNSEQRGTPVGVQYSYNGTAVNASSVDAGGNPVPNSTVNGVPVYQSGAFTNIPSTFKSFFDAYKRRTYNADASYFISNLWGSHTFKGGYFYQAQSNSTLSLYNTASVLLYWGQKYGPQTSTTVCDPIIAQNAANPAFNGKAGQAGCTGLYGYYTVRDGVDNSGSDQQTANALYFQDSWSVGKTGLTLNVGVRFDEENQPPYDPSRFPTVHFGFGQKTAPRIGGAYDLLHNGKVKVFASYGQFYDIMKMGLARGSFGSDYWHDCVYTLDSVNYAQITPTAPSISVNGGAPGPHACPPTGGAPGVTVGRFIENVDLRATKADPRDPAIQPDMSPMKQHEFVTGVDWAISNDWSLETRYSRKRLDNTIEDMAITDNLGFYIGNPGSTFADVLHRPVVIPDAANNNYLTSVPFCAECPAAQKAVRNYDGFEIRLAKRPTGRWFGALSYTYSALRGNYSGLTDTDPTDGGGGRHAPNNERAFDIPNMSYDVDGKPDYGPLATDRPHTATIFGYYRQKWFAGQESLFGFSQSIFQGTPINTCLSAVGVTGSACQLIGRGVFANVHRDASTGNVVLDSLDTNARTDAYMQTDFNLTHEIPVSKTHEGMRLKFEANITNLFNNRSAVAYNQIIGAGATPIITPGRASRFSGDPAIDFGKVMNGFNFVDAFNGTGAFTGLQKPLTLANRYGMAQVFQGARQMRLAFRFIF